MTTVFKPSDYQLHEVGLTQTLKSRKGAPGRLAGTGPVAVVDIGSNTIRLVLYERLSRAVTPLFNEKVICELGRSVSATGVIDTTTGDKAIAGLRRFRQLCQQSNTERVFAIASAAVRDASNGQSFIEVAVEALGQPIKILSGADEARFAALGVRAGVKDAKGVVADLGGGSLELIDLDGPQEGAGHTFGLGALKLRQRSDDHPPMAFDLARIELNRIDQHMSIKGKTLYAVGGTWRALARLHMMRSQYPLHIMHGYSISPKDLYDLCRTLIFDDLDSIKKLGSVSKQRRPLLPYGAATMAALIEKMEPGEIVLSSLGVREGVLFDQLSELEKKKDPLLEACRELAFLYSRSPEHADELVAWTDQLPEVLGYDETLEERRLRHAASLLADVHWRAHPDYRGTQALSFIAYAAFIGVGHSGRAFLAMSNFVRHEGLGNSEGVDFSFETLSNDRLLHRARILGLAFRVAYLVSASMPGVLTGSRLVREGDTLSLTFPETHRDLAGDRLGRRLASLARFCGLSV